MMKVRLLIFLFAVASTTLSLTAEGQRKVWNDDRRAEPKADTSIVVIQDQTYRKVVAVSYAPISEEILREEFDAKREQLRQRRRQLVQDQRRDSLELAKLEHELAMERTFFRMARKELKIATKEVDDLSDNKRQEQEEKQNRRNQLIQGNIIENPRKKRP